MENFLKENERLDDLGCNHLQIIQNKKEFCFGMDSVLLTEFAKDIKSGKAVVDLGTGTGIIPILLSAKTNAKEITGIEIQENMCEMAKRSIELNNLQKKIQIINEDIKNLTKIYNKESFDVVITNPPYKKDATGIKNEAEGKMISKHEVMCTLEDIITTAKYLLKDKGAFYMVHRPERIVDICELLKKNKIEPKVMRWVYPKLEKPANLVLIKAIKNAKEFIKVEKPLVIYNEKGNYTEEVFKIYDKNVEE